MEEVTLLFRHLPMELSVEERKDLLHYLGAKRVQIMSGKGRMKNTAFAVFQSKEEALKIIKDIHEAEFMGSNLKVEFAHVYKSRATSVVDNEGVENKEGANEENSKKDGEDKEEPVVKEIKFDDTFQTWGLHHQRRPDLCYLYPPPSSTTLTNIMHALAAVPKFYVQVLHLMNKMDLPAPFGAVTSAPPVYQEMRGHIVTDDAVQQEMDISSDTESELESDQEQKIMRSKEQDQVKSLLKKRLSHQRKRPRLTDLRDTDLPKPEGSTVEGPAPALTEVFEQALSEHVASARKIELKISSSKQTPTTSIKHHGGSPPRPSLSPATDVLHSQAAAFHRPQTESHQDRSSLDLHRPSQSATAFKQNLPPVFAQSLLQPQNFSSVTQDQYQPELGGRTASPLPDPDYSNLYDVPLPPQQPEQQQRLHSTTHHNQETVAESGSQTHRAQESSDELSTGGGFGILQPQQRTNQQSDQEEDMQEKEWTRSEFISSSELKRSRLSHSEMKDYSVFRRYNEGDPSCRLYIKNLAKQVTEEDIHWIFGRYVDWDDPTEKLRFDIRLMKEGRMKGQAFVALPSEQMAASALKDTNGFLLKEKPMVVQYARSAKAQEEASSSKPK